MRIPTGTTDQYIYFVAVDSTDLKTRKTGLSSFTVYRIRNAASTPTAYTTPTVTEVSSANMPGVYSLLLDEDMTIGSGNQSEEICLHITQASMAPVTRIIELYRPSVTDGERITVASGIPVANVTQYGGSNGTFSGGRPEVNTTHIAGSAVSTSSAQIGVNVVNAAGTAWNSGAITANTLASGAITAAKFAANALDAVWSTATRLLTAGTNIVLAKGTGLTGLNDLDAAGVRTAVGLASANLDTQLSGIKNKTDNLPSDPADQSLIIAATDAIMTAVGDVPTNAELATALGTADDAVLAQIALVKAKTDSLTFTTAGQVDANIQYVNDVEVIGNGQTGTEWGPA